MVDMCLGRFRDCNEDALEDGKSQSVLECTRMQPLGRPAGRTEGNWPNGQDSLLRPHFPKTKTGRMNFVPLEKFGGAIQISILPWPDSRALVSEAGSARGITFTRSWRGTVSSTIKLVNYYSR